jgi:hypothetical protein
MATEKTKKYDAKYCCKKCDFYSSKKTDYTRHLATQKHNFSVLTTQNNEKTTIHITYECQLCSKYFNDRSGLWRHKKKCIGTETLVEANVMLQYQQKIDKLTDVVLDIVNKNSELTKQICELSSKPNINVSNNNNNKTFNLNVFLNEECKNALNIRDFVESIQIQLSDLENTGQVGYVEGISQIFINNLSKLNNHERPIHCSDYKREVLYIKNENKWIKETEDKQTIKNAIKQVANKNIKQIKNWQEKYPEYNNPDSKQNDKYMKIVLNSMSGSTEEEQKNNINKIIKNVAKEVIIEK